MWFPGRWDKGQGCSGAVSTGKGHQEGERESSEAQKPPRDVLRSTGSAGHPWVLQSITAQSRVCKPPGPAQGYPVSHWRCFPRRGLSTYCPAAWRQLLRITNAAKNRQEVTGPQPCPPRPEHAAGTRGHSRIPEPPQCSPPGLWTRGHMGENHQHREFRCLRLSPGPVQAGQEQNKIFPWTLSHLFIFKQDPEEEEEDLPGVYRCDVYRHHCRPQPPQFSPGSEPGASALLGLGRSGAGRDSAGNPRRHRDSFCDPQKRDADGKNKHTHKPQHLGRLWGKENTPRGEMCTQRGSH